MANSGTTGAFPDPSGIGVGRSATVAQRTTGGDSIKPYVGAKQGELSSLANGTPIPGCADLQVTGEPVDCYWWDAPPGTCTATAKYLGYASFANGAFVKSPRRTRPMSYP